MKDKNFNRNPEGNNQYELRSDTEIQKIIDSHPNWTKADFIGRGKLNLNGKNALLTRTETERKNLVFGHVGKRKKPLKDIYKLSTKENIRKFENNKIDEDKFRKNALNKSYNDKMSQSEKIKRGKLLRKNLTAEQKESIRENKKKYIKNLSGSALNKYKKQSRQREIKRWATMSEAEKEIKRENDKEYQVREQKSQKRWATMSEAEKEIKRKKERERYKKNKFLKMKN